MLQISRAIGLEDGVNAANWQEMVRWLLRSRLDPDSRKELLAKEVEEESGSSGVCAYMYVHVWGLDVFHRDFFLPFPLVCSFLRSFILHFKCCVILNVLQVTWMEIETTPGRRCPQSCVPLVVYCRHLC